MVVSGKAGVQVMVRETMNAKSYQHREKLLQQLAQLKSHNREIFIVIIFLQLRKKMLSKIEPHSRNSPKCENIANKGDG